MNHLIIFVILILGQHSMAQLVEPTKPNYETCPQIQVPNENDSDNGHSHGTHLETDPACLERNAIKERDYNAQVGVYNRATQLLGPNSKEVVKPTEPQYETCATNNDGDTIDWACEQRNQAKRQEYSIQSAGYDQAIQMQNQALATATAEQRQRDEASARAAAEEAQRKNKDSSDTYKTAADLCGIVSAGYAVAFGISCIGAGVTCTYPLLYKSMAFAVLSAMASSQASSNESSGYNACLVANQVASDGGADCGAPPPPFNPQSLNNQIGALFDSNGNCIGAPEKCARVIKSLPSGMSKKDLVAGLKYLDKNKPYTINKDGSATTKDGKTYTADNFANEAAMMAAGMSAADAKALAAKIKGINTSALAKETGKGGGAFGDAGGGSLANGKGTAPNGNASLEKNIGGGEKPRELASADGLAKEFNGEMIGVAGDNIFKMMNRRYKLKTAQDNFIVPAP